MVRRVAHACFVCLPLLTVPMMQAHANVPAAGADLERGGRTVNAALVPAAPEPRALRAGRPYRLDRDDDGTISREEAEAHYDWLFGLLDQDHDGEIREPEFKSVLRLKQRDPGQARAHLARLAALFQNLDMNDDRMLAPDEFLGACKAHFQTSDADGDGEVSVVEFRSRRPL